MKPISQGQMTFSDFMLAAQKSADFVLIAIDGEDVGVYSTFGTDMETATYLGAALKAVSADE